jgi:hypothetical protein
VDPGRSAAVFTSELMRVGNYLHRLRELSRTVGPLRALWIAPAWGVGGNTRSLLVTSRRRSTCPGQGPSCGRQWRAGTTSRS